MKFTLVVCVVICFVGGYCDTASKSEDRQYVTDCMIKNNVDQKMVDALMKFNSYTMNLSTMCLCHCLMKYKNMVDDEGNMLGAHKKSIAFAECQNISGKDKCEKAAKIMDCVMNKLGLGVDDIQI